MNYLEPRGEILPVCAHCGTKKAIGVARWIVIAGTYYCPNCYDLVPSQTGCDESAHGS